MQQRILYGVAGALLVIFVFYHGCRLFSGDRVDTPEALAAAALGGDDVDAKEAAAAALTGHPDRPAARAQLRRVLSESDEPRVRAICLEGLARVYDYDSMPQILAALDDSDPLVQMRAVKAAGHMMGRGFGVRPNDSEKERAKKIQQIRDEWDKMKDSELLKEAKARLQAKSGE